MPGKATIASVSGLVAGVAAMAAINSAGAEVQVSRVVLIMASWLGAMVCLTVVSMAALRKWINAHDQSTRAAAEQMARERRAFVEASALRARELNEREARLTKQAEQVNAYVLGVARRLDEALTRNTRLESDLSALTRSYEELAEDHNRLIRETLQERVDRFQRRPVPTTRKTVAPSVHTSPTTDSTPVRTYADPDGGHHPVPPIPLRRIPVPAAHLVDQPQHERPTEGVGGGTA